MNEHRQVDRCPGYGEALRLAHWYADTTGQVHAVVRLVDNAYAVLNYLPDCGVWWYPDGKRGDKQRKRKG